MNNISDIQIGQPYHISDYEWPLRNFVSPDKHMEHPWNVKDENDILAAGTSFVPLEINKTYLEDVNYSYIHFIKILTISDEVRWLPILDKDLPYIFPMTNCDKQL